MSAIGERSDHAAGLVGPVRRIYPHSNAGFTLIELLVALAISALIVGIAFPGLQNQLNRSARAEARTTLALVLVEAHADAIATHTPVQVSLLRDRRTLQSSSGRPAKVLPAETSLEWPDAGFLFFADGSANGGTGAIRTSVITSSGSPLGGDRGQQFSVDTSNSRIVFAP